MTTLTFLTIEMEEQKNNEYALDMLSDNILQHIEYEKSQTNLSMHLKEILMYMDNEEFDGPDSFDGDSYGAYTIS